MAVAVKGKRMRELRQIRTLSIKELAELAGVSDSTIYKMENSDHRPRPDTMRTVARILKVKPEDLLYEARELVEH